MIVKIIDDPVIQKFGKYFIEKLTRLTKTDHRVLIP